MRRKRGRAGLAAVVMLGFLGLLPCSGQALEKGPAEGELRSWEKKLADVYTEAQRKAIFRKIGVAEDKAAAESKPVYASKPAEEAVEFQRALQRKYVTEVLDKYGVTPAQELELYTEALENQWAAEPSNE